MSKENDPENSFLVCTYVILHIEFQKKQVK